MIHVILMLGSSVEINMCEIKRNIKTKTLWEHFQNPKEELQKEATFTFCRLGTGTLIKGGRIKLVSCAQTSPFIEIIRSHMHVSYTCDQNANLPPPTYNRTNSAATKKVSIPNISHNTSNPRHRNSQGHCKT